MWKDPKRGDFNYVDMYIERERGPDIRIVFGVVGLYSRSFSFRGLIVPASVLRVPTRRAQ